MADHFNGLTPAEAERLALLAEECAEVIVAVGKVLRHGYESYNPTEYNGYSNRRTLMIEMGDVRAAMIMLCDAGDVQKEGVHAQADHKLKCVRQWLSYRNSVAEFPMIAHAYCRDLLQLAAAVLEDWTATESEYDQALVAAIREWCKPYSQSDAGAKF